MPIVEIITKVRFFCKQLKTLITARCNLFDTIIIVIILDILYSNFKIIIASILKSRIKIIKEIQSIIQLKKARYKTKQLIDQLKDIGMAAAMILHGGSNFQKQKANSKDEYYNYHKQGYYNQDC